MEETQEKRLRNDDRIEKQLVKWQHYCKREQIEHEVCQQYVLFKVRM